MGKGRCRGARGASGGGCGGAAAGQRAQRQGAMRWVSRGLRACITHLFQTGVAGGCAGSRVVAGGAHPGALQCWRGKVARLDSLQNTTGQALCTWTGWGQRAESDKRDAFMRPPQLA